MKRIFGLIFFALAFPLYATEMCTTSVVAGSGPVSTTTVVGTTSVCSVGAPGTANSVCLGSSAITGEGATADSFKTLFAFGDATASQTLTCTGAASSLGCVVAAPSTGLSTTAGNALALTGSAAIAGSTNAGAAAGGAVTLTGGAAARFTSGNADGGGVTLAGGAGIGTGVQGAITLNTATTARASVTAGSLSANLFDVVGALPASSGNNDFGSVFNCSSSGTTGAGQRACVLHYFPAGVTAPGSNFGNYNLLAAAGTAATPFNVADTTSLGNLAVFSQTTSTTAGANVGSYGLGSNGSGASYGSFGACDTGSVCTGATGYSSGGTIRVGSYSSLIASAPNVSTALLADNGAVAAPIAIFRDNAAALPTTGATNTFAILDGGIPQVGTAALTSATMTAENQALLTGSAIHSYTWTNAQVAALAGTAGDITVATLPAKTVVKNAYVVITGAAAGPATVTVACGRTSASFIDYIVASDAKAAANTVYGDASAERGTNLTGFDLPSYTGTTTVTCHFISTGANLSTTTGSTGRVILETSLLP